MWQLTLYNASFVHRSYSVSRERIHHQIIAVACAIHLFNLLLQGMEVQNAMAPKLLHPSTPRLLHVLHLRVPVLTHNLNRRADTAL